MEKIDIIAEVDEDFRADVYISATLGSKSRTYIQKLIKDKLILINGKQTKPSYIIQDGDYIEIAIPEPIQLDVEPENIDLDIVYEDDSIVVINKGKGMVVHPAPGNYSGTLVNALMYHFKDKLSTINGVNRPGIVHRIDKDTTGLIVVAKNDYAHSFLMEQFKVHSISREYEMIVVGRPKDDMFTISEPIGRCPKNRLKMAVVKNGKSATTHFKVYRRYSNYSYLRATLETGRTHQIRVHSSFKGHPILGDSLYYSGKSPFKTYEQCLHARLLGFIHPETKEYIVFEQEAPEYFLNILNKLGNDYEEVINE